MKKILIFMLCILLLSGCSFDAKREKTLFAMDTEIELAIYGKKKAMERAETEIARLSEKYSVENLENAIKNYDAETEEILNTATKIKQETNGAFDVSVAPIMRIWGFYSHEFGEKKHRIPTAPEIEEALATASSGKYIDLGGIAKGYCADRVVQVLKEEGVKSAVLSLGGNVALIGAKDDGTPYTIGIKSPFDEGLYATIKAQDTMVVTSGDYVRYFEENGKIYHHIINPKTGYPAESDLKSVTIISDSGIYADCLSTALFVMGKDNAINYWKEKQDFEMILIDKDGKIYATERVDISTEHELSIIKEQ